MLVETWQPRYSIQPGSIGVESLNIPQTNYTYIMWHCLYILAYMQTNEIDKLMQAYMLYTLLSESCSLIFLSIWVIFGSMWSIVCVHLCDHLSMQPFALPQLYLMNSQAFISSFVYKIFHTTPAYRHHLPPWFHTTFSDPDPGRESHQISEQNLLSWYS